MKRLHPLFEVNGHFRMLPGFGWVQLAKGEQPVVGDLIVSSKENARTLNRLHGRALRRKRDV